MQISRTYPPPDSPREDLGPRERAMAVFKYLLDMEPEAAIKHSRFALLVHAFEQEARRQLRKILREEHNIGEEYLLPKMEPTLEADIQGHPRQVRII